MIPARMGSQRLKKKNLREIGGGSLISRAIRKCRAAGVFERVVVNSENDEFREIAHAEGCEFHQRPEELGNNLATSEQYVTEFLRSNPCDYLVQVHSIAPLLSVDQIRAFCGELAKGECDVLLSVVEERIECLYRGSPVNFTIEEKTNSQDLVPVERVTWSITGWRRSKFLEAVDRGVCATYFGRVGTFPIDREAGHVIKTEDDLRLAAALWKHRDSETAKREGS
jgi:CMP-N-acetylneuraminic acid synthetase